MAAGDHTCGDWDWDLFDLSCFDIPLSGSSVDTPGDCALPQASTDPKGAEANAMTLARALRRRGWPRVRQYRPRKNKVEAEIEKIRMDQCMQVAKQNAELASAILKIDDTNALATAFKGRCSIVKLQNVIPINTDSKSSRSMGPYKHLFWDWISVMETGIMPPALPHLPKEFIQDIKVVLRKKNSLRWCSVEDIIGQAELMRFQWRHRNVYKREFSESGQKKILKFNTMLRAELLSLNPCA